MSDVAIVILAAGASTRFGSPKQLALIDGKPMVRRAVDAARAAGAAQVIVVLGAAAEDIAPLLLDVTVVVNERWRDGLSSSVAKGIEAAESMEHALLLLADQVRIDAEDLRRLIDARDESMVVAASYAGLARVPAIFPRAHFAELKSLRGDSGARALLRNARRVPMPNAAFDVDTIADMRTAG
jgi:molybdenum cofactor cytidylyltransferase